MPSRTFLTAILIPIAAAAAVSAVSYAPFGDIFRTLRGMGAEEVTSPIALSGMEKAEIQIVVGRKESDASQIRIALSEHDVSQAKRVSLTVPSAWQLSEVRGVHIAAIDEARNGDALTLSMPIPPVDIELVFSAQGAFDTIAFSHDSAMPVLVTSSHIDLGESHVQTFSKLVNHTETYSICTHCA